MSDIPGFWQGGPHRALLVEAHWREFVRNIGGTVLDDHLPEPRAFENADFAFPTESVVAELKEIETEFSSSHAFAKGIHALMEKIAERQPNWKPKLHPDGLELEEWFKYDFVRLFRPALARILKKANRQLRETKEHLQISSTTGVLLLVNDGFRSISPMLIRAQIAELLQHSYTSIDCFIYTTVNRYVEISGSDEPRLLWLPSYSDRASESLVDFVDALGTRWFEHLESKVGTFTSRKVGPNIADLLHGSRYIVMPGEADG